MVSNSWLLDLDVSVAPMAGRLQSRGLGTKGSRTTNDTRRTDNDRGDTHLLDNSHGCLLPSRAQFSGLMMERLGTMRKLTLTVCIE